MSFLWAILSITIIDLALSGDNAAVIGLAIKNLPLQQRKIAAFIGAGGAIVLRVTLTAVATLLLRIPYLNAIGGIILIWITWKLLNGEDSEENVKASNKFWSAVGTIIVADLSMAFDNIMGVAGAAHGHVGLMIFGLAVSIPILVLGASWLATMMNRYPIIIYIGGAVLAHTSLAMIFADHGLGLPNYTGELAATLIPWALAAAVFIWGWLQVRKTGAGHAEKMV
ncbi:TerC family protein [Moorella sp. Hama-1]|uniref:TerC family protein n=1 Tax=Moorella sp. Hama-1 TaxID=2138101 RepID=UPI00137ACF1A|nr:TerC family protein [Moorella sp. Hama-1]BCV20957.1 membrane protein [Moorella sp. Hama-1]